MKAAVMPSGLDLTSLIRQHQSAVWRYLRVLGCDASLADDLTQETFLSVLERPFEDYHPTATAKYLRTVARNLFISLQRRHGRDVSLEDLDQLDADWARLASDGGQQLLEALQHCFQALDDKPRQALELRFKSQSSRAEIAGTLGMTEDGAKNLMQRAKKRLRACIERRLQG